MSDNPKILVLEGPLSQSISNVLGENWSVVPVTDAAQVLSRAEGAALVILDALAMGTEPEAYRQLEERLESPVLVILPPLDIGEQVAGIRVPFDQEALVDRVRELLNEAPLDIVKVGGLVIDMNCWRVTRRGQPVALSTLEFRLLAYLARRKGEVVTYEELLAEVWDFPPGEDDEKLVMRCIHRLRQKLEDDPSHPV